MNDFDQTLHEAIATSPRQEALRLNKPKYPRTVYLDEFEEFRIVADAPGKFLVFRDGNLLHSGTPVECRLIYNELINRREIA